MSADLGENGTAPSRGRVIMATIVVVLVVLATWAFIEYRSQPPPPPNPVRSPSATP